MGRYIVIHGNNGWGAQGPSNLYDKIREYNDKKATIHVVAIGENDQWAVVTSEGSSWSAKTGSGFCDKMKSITCSDIKSISFGPDSTWAIVMKSGFCHARAFSGNSGPLDKINEHQHDIKYVGMTANKGEWIVGYGNSGFTWMDLPETLIEYLRGVKVGGTIQDVKLGCKNSKWFVESNRNTRWNFDNDSEFHSKAKVDGARLWSIW